MTTTAVVLSLDEAWILPLLEVIEYSEGNAWVYVRMRGCTSEPREAATTRTATKSPSTVVFTADEALRLGIRLMAMADQAEIPDPKETL